MKLFQKTKQESFSPDVEVKELKHCASSTGGGGGNGGGGINCKKPEQVEIDTTERSFTM